MTADLRTPSSGNVVAAFDFDKTLSSRDCVVPFLRSVMSSKRLLPSVLDFPKGLAAGMRRDRDDLKAIVSRRVFAGMHRSELEAAATDFARRVHESWLRSDMLEVLKKHREQSHRAGIVSASYGLYLRPIGEKLGLDFVIGTELEFDDRDVATGRLIGGNCRGPEKASRLATWLASSGLDRCVLYAYGDSAGDKEMLAMADHPHLVGKAFES